MTRNALQIKTDGTLVNLDLDGPEGSYQTLNTGVAGWIECVAFKSFDMYVNEEGKITNPPLPVNTHATMLLEVEFGVGADVVCGDVVLCGRPDDEGDNTAFREDVERVVRRLIESGYTA